MRTRNVAPLPLLTAAALAAAACAAARAEPKPLWEFGLGAGALVFYDYRGADTLHVYPVPVPYLVYRGKFLRSDHRGLRGRLLDQDRIALNLSVNGTTPVRSDSARHGMPDLRPTLEVGPSLDVHLWKSATALVTLDVRLPARAAFTVEASPRMVGLFLAPHVNLDIAQRRGADGWKLGLLAGPLFANRRYDDYFYSVAPQYATADRPAFQAHRGYAGTQFIAALTRRYPSCWLGAYLRHDTLAGASFADSPLVRRDSYWSGGFGVAWIIRRSSRLVDSED
jgi:MipA family protein